MTMYMSLSISMSMSSKLSVEINIGKSLLNITNTDIAKVVDTAMYKDMDMDQDTTYFCEIYYPCTVFYSKL